MFIAYVYWEPFWDISYMKVHETPIIVISDKKLPRMYTILISAIFLIQERGLNKQITMSAEIHKLISISKIF
jgi:hypothetical protein